MPSELVVASIGLSTKFIKLSHEMFSVVCESGVFSTSLVPGFVVVTRVIIKLQKSRLMVFSFLIDSSFRTVFCHTSINGI